MALTSDPVLIIKRCWGCLSTMKRIRLVKGVPGDVIAITPVTVSLPGTGLLALLGVSAEVGVVEAQTIGGFDRARSGP